MELDATGLLTAVALGGTLPTGFTPYLGYSILVKPRAPVIGGVVVGEDVAGCVAGSVVVLGEGTAGLSEALHALSEGLSSRITS